MREQLTDLPSIHQVKQAGYSLPFDFDGEHFVSQADPAERYLVKDAVKTIRLDIEKRITIYCIEVSGVRGFALIDWDSETSDKT